MAILTGDNNWAVAKYIVDSTAGQGTHTTITSALAAASSGDVVAVRQGTYTEDPVMPAGVTLTTLGGSQLTPTVTIIGKVTMTEAGRSTIQGICLQTNGDYAISVTGSNATTLFLQNCFLHCTDNTGIEFTNSNSLSFISFNFSRTDLETTGIALYSKSSPGNLAFIFCNLVNSGSSTTLSNNSAGTVAFADCLSNIGISTSSTGFVNIFPGCTFTPAINLTPLTLAGSGTSNAFSSTFGGGTASSISIGSGTTLNACNLTVTSSNTNAITGLGILNRGLITFNGTSSTINTSTQNAKGTSIGNVASGICGTAFVLGRTNGSAPVSGYIGEQITSSVASPGASIATTTPSNITSISLTAGVWDVSGVGGFVGWTTASQIVVSIGTTSATLGTLGNNRIDNTGGTVAGSISQCLTIPSYRINVSSTTTVYLVGYIAYTAGTATAFGTIRATRVG